MLGRKLRLPAALEAANLPVLLSMDRHRDILDLVCAQCEPDAADYIRVSTSIVLHVSGAVIKSSLLPCLLQPIWLSTFFSKSFVQTNQPVKLDNPLILLGLVVSSDALSVVLTDCRFTMWCMTILKGGDCTICSALQGTLEGWCGTS